MTSQDRRDDSSVCRFCPSTGECASLYESANFHTTSSGAQLTEIVFGLSEVAITPEDGGPQHICVDKCLPRLIDCYLFRQQILNAEEHRRNLPMAVDTKIEIEIATDAEDEYETEFLVYEEENRDKEEAEHRDQSTNCLSTENIVLPPKELIVTRLEFDNFDYIAYKGEKCCGCDAFLGSMIELEAHAEDTHGTIAQFARTEYSCPICGRIFQSEADLEKHEQSSKSKELFLCKVCLQGFQGKNTFMVHMDTHQLTSNDKMVDDPGRQGLSSASSNKEPVEPPVTSGHDIEINNQLPNSTEDKSYRQRFLSKLPVQNLISSVDDYEQYQIVHVDNAERCCGCGVYFESFEQLQDHARSQHHIDKDKPQDKPFCEICHERFKSPWALNAHKTHCRYVKELYYCKLCGIVYARKFHIIKHFQTTPGHTTGIGILKDVAPEETKERRSDILMGFSCCFLKCAYTFETEKLLVAHVDEQHIPRRKINMSERSNEDYVCTICQRSFGSQQLLLLHRNRALKKKHICSFCAESFLIPSTLREHELLVHSGTIPQHPCDICYKTFRTKNLLKAHCSTHDQARDFSCDQCGAQFRFRFQLKKHVRGVHPTCFPYECKYCVKKFSTKAKHDLHLRSHTGEKPYPCRHDSCGKQFSHVTDRKRHEMGVHTGERPYRCDQCSAAYIRKRELLIHMQKHPTTSQQ